ncbi:MAG: 50S ribosomal protein L32 [Cyanobacteria bacterium]|jgi:large subunit ribosomal protein L32|nr:50S ribosomal protein L32 [Cyanobacteria bacterium GSL.Bin21]
MAVPKKKRSKAKKRTHKSLWKGKATAEAQKALSLGKSILSGRSTFVYPTNEDDEDDEE